MNKMQDILNAVYLGAAAECEGREREGKLVGNGHHMAQKIQQNVKDELIRRKVIDSDLDREGYLNKVLERFIGNKLLEETKKRVIEYFDVLWKFCPAIATTPQLAYAFILRQVTFGDDSMGDIRVLKELCDIQLTYLAYAED